jgi:hypothetical protein
VYFLTAPSLKRVKRYCSDYYSREINIENKESAKKLIHMLVFFAQGEYELGQAIKITLT